MRCGVPLLDQRVAPRCTAADALMVIAVAESRVVSRDQYPFEITGLFDLLDAVGKHRIDTLICGGIDRDTKESVQAMGAEVVENVACPAQAVIEAIENSTLAPGYRVAVSSGEGGTVQTAGGGRVREVANLDCLSCRNKVCLSGQNCLAEPLRDSLAADPVARRMIETAFDLTLENERKLCRIAETVYFCLEMGYRKIGLAFCTELLQPTRILTGVLRRFFEVIPVCCRVGGATLENGGASGLSETSPRSPHAICNPLGQAEVLNLRETDFNLAVGLCIGADSVFARASNAPVSPLFVKDRSLANNPIGALYSDYYLHESVTPAGRALSPDRPFHSSAVIKEET